MSSEKIELQDWVYLGKRIADSGKLVWAFGDPKNQVKRLYRG